jgi:hypothetical protein
MVIHDCHRPSDLDIDFQVFGEADSPGVPQLGTTLEVLAVAGTVCLFAGTGANVVVQAGEEGAIFVDTRSAAVSDPLLAEVRKLTKPPIRYVSVRTKRAGAKQDRDLVRQHDCRGCHCDPRKGAVHGP